MKRKITYYSGIDLRTNTTVDHLDEVYKLLESAGAELGVMAYCKKLFGHAHLTDLDEQERHLLAITVREKLVESAIQTGTVLYDHGTKQ